MSKPPRLRLRRAVLEELELPLVRTFSTSFGTERRRRVLLLSIEERGGEVGYAECVAGRDPLYSYESVDTARTLLSRYLLPALGRLSREQGDVDAPGFLRAAEAVRGHPMAKAVVEMALLDLAARKEGVPLQRLLRPRGPVRDRVEVGVSVGMQSSPRRLVGQVAGYLQEGYRRIKLKIEPGRDVVPVLSVRRAFPKARIWVDANQAYDRGGLPRLLSLARRARLELLEQPFREDAWGLHAELSRRLPRSTRLCLDESVASPALFDLALALGATRTLNLKPARVGGLTRAVAIHDRAMRAGLPIWCGGMLETGVGRAHNLHLASLPDFRLPSDLSASGRYWAEDLVDPPFDLQPGSSLRVPKGPGIGVAPVEGRVRRSRVAQRSWRLSKYI